MFSYAAWQATDAEFKAQWHICDGTSGTVNLVDRFPRGTNSATGVTGGTDTAQLPRHAHKHTHTDHDGTIYSDSPGANMGGAPLYGSGVFTSTARSGWSSRNNDLIGSLNMVNFNAGHNEDETYAGSENADNRPAFTSVIFIQKIAA
jgi:hypothetical protein